ncbi:glycosyltransferase family 4 protein [Solemya velum gill symbiont]|uniref:glycosyltransferase family 4 protein n=1 Tax=Solemya velum gill symbiont TaxID=2340 RepID=UPI000998C4CB|nr:glycosyltransferase family 1 protein [Solemya velum gill symbiont]OOZ12284.1 hypothetical protein BOW25_08970 [Solemya velum gill symbiont]
MKILIITDAWFPLVNGVVHTLDNTSKELVKRGHEVVVIHPGLTPFRTFSLPTYAEIRLPWNPWRVGGMICKAAPDAIHIATEGTLGIAARLFCGRRGIPYTSSYHTKTPEYIQCRFRWFSLAVGYAFMRWLHKKSSAVLVTTESVKRELDERKLHPNLLVWSRGADFDLFHPDKRTRVKRRPVLAYVGRVSIEKNLEAFLDLPDDHYDKVIVGDGPDLVRLRKEYDLPSISFVGYKHGAELAEAYANADVFVFPSKTDTFGIVMIESNACGTPVAAYPFTGPVDFIVNGVNGYCNPDLQAAVERSLKLDRAKVRGHVVAHYSWQHVTDLFEDALIHIEDLKSRI